jgi:hypothetical protein
MKNNQSDENRYIDLQGYPLHKPLWQVFHQSAAANAIALTSVFAVAADALVTGGLHISQSILPLAPSLAMSTAIALFVQKFYLNKLCFKDDLEKYAIDTQPDHKTPPTSSANLTKALLAQKMFRNVIVAQAAVDLLVNTPLISSVSLSNTSKSEFAAFLLGRLAWSIPAYAVYGASYLRFHKVTNLDHAIVDPPAKKVEQKIEAGQQQTAFQPI